MIEKIEADFQLFTQAFSQDVSLNRTEVGGEVDLWITGQVQDTHDFLGHTLVVFLKSISQLESSKMADRQNLALTFRR